MDDWTAKLQRHRGCTTRFSECVAMCWAPLLLVASLLLVPMPFAPSSFLLLVVRPGAPSSVLAPKCGLMDPQNAGQL